MLYKILILTHFLSLAFAMSNRSTLPEVSNGDTEVRFLNGGVTTLKRLVGEKGLVIVARESGCPISEKYGPKLSELEKYWTPKGVPFVFVYYGTRKIPESASLDQKKFGFQGHYLVDPEYQLKEKFRFNITTEVILLDSKLESIYRGAVDDQHSLSGSKPSPSKNYLQSAISSFVSGSHVAISETEAPGCVISEVPKSKELDFNSAIFPIIEKKCLICHRHENSTIHLGDYQSVKSRHRMIGYVLENKIMPPWHMKEKLGTWINDLSLSSSERQLMLKWLRSGMPEGSGEIRASIDWASSWTFGKPQKVVSLPKKIKVPASGTLPYQHFIIENPFKKEVWVKGFEILPKPQVIHHVMFYVLKDPSKTDPKSFPFNFSSRFGWAPGNPPMIFPKGVGVRISKNAKIAITVHYEPIGREVTDDTTKIGFHLHLSPPPHESVEWVLYDEKLNIPAGVKNFKNKNTFQVEEGATITGLNVHMHYRGQKSKINITLPNGRTYTALDVDPYNMNFQHVYQYLDPVYIPKGSTIECINYFDNSQSNEVNPNANVSVQWGDKVTDEMSLCSVYGYR